MIVHGYRYVSDLHYLQEATVNDSASSLVTKAHRWNLGKRQQDEDVAEGGEVQQGKKRERTTQRHSEKVKVCLILIKL